MTQITSNMFKMDLSLDSKIIEEPIQNLNQTLDTTNGIENFTKNKRFLEEVSKIKYSSSTHKVSTFEEISLTNDNFTEYHYSLMKGKYLIVIYDKEISTYKYLTQSGTVFIVTDLKLVELINTVPLPIKLTFDYVPKITDENILSFKCICKVLYNISLDSPEKLIKGFIKKEVIPNFNSEYSILLHIFLIYPKIEALITKHMYWKYIHMENNVYYIASKCMDTGYEIDELLLQERFTKISEELMSLVAKFNISTQTLISPIKTLKFIKDNTDYLPTLDKYLLKQLKYDDIYNLMNSFYNYCTLRSLKENKSIVSINTHNSQGLIHSSELAILNVFKGKKVIKGSYRDIFFKLLASITYNKDLISLSNENNLINALLEECETTSDLNLYYCTHYIKGILNGFKTEEELMKYFQNSLKTVMYSDTFKITEKIYNSNLSKLKDLINSYNTQKYLNHKVNILSHKETSNLNTIINNKHRLIIKDLILEIDNYIKEFNSKNKHKIDIYYIQSDSIYLIADEEAIPVAMDIFTRTMPKIFNKYCSAIKPTCNIDIIE